MQRAMRGAWRSGRRQAAAGFARAVPDALIDFRSGAWPGAITFVRAGAASRIDASGSLAVEPANVPLIDHDPATLARLGWLTQESRSNPLNTALTGGAAGIPGTQPTGWNTSTAPSGMQRSLDYGTEDGMPYVEVRYWGTVPAGTTNVTVSFAGTSAHSAAPGQTWTQSFFARLTAGSWGNVLPASSPLATNGSSGVQSFDETIYPTAERLSSQRFSRTATLTNLGTTHFQPRFRFGLTASTNVDFTVRIAWPQISQHAFETAPIAGGTTRPVEVATITDASALLGGPTSRGTIAVDARVLGAPTTGAAALLSLGTGLDDRMQLRVHSTTGLAGLRVVRARNSVYDGGVAMAALDRKMAIAWGPGRIDAWCNGVRVAALATEPPAFTAVRLGGGGGSVEASAIYRSAAFWGRALSPDALRRLTM